MKLLIVRHGETIENQNGIIQGHLPGKLSEKGIQQAKKLAIRLKDEKLSVIFSSDLARAFDTSKIIAHYHPNSSIMTTALLRERSMGLHEGKYHKDIENFFDRDDIESKDSIMRRVKNFLENIQRDYSEKSVLVVCHGGTIVALVANALNKSFDEVVEMRNIENTAITIFNPYPNLAAIAKKQ